MDFLSPEMLMVFAAVFVLFIVAVGAVFTILIKYGRSREPGADTRRGEHAKRRKKY
jgi:hypothetical protein